MSLQIDESGRRGRSRSPSGRRREPDDDYERERDRSRGRPPVDAVPYPEAPEVSRGGADRDAAYEYERVSTAHVRTASPPQTGYYGRGSHERVSSDVGAKYSDGRREKQYHYEKERERDRDRDPDREKAARDAQRSSLQFLPQKYASKMAPDEPESPRYSRESLAREREREKDRDSDRERERQRQQARERYEERDRAGHRDSDKDSDRERERERQRARERYEERDRAGHRDSDRDSERERERERQRARERFEEQKRDRDRDRDRERERDRDNDRDRGYGRDRDRDRRDKYDEDLAYGSGPILAAPKPSARPKSPRPESPPGPGGYTYADPKQWEYAKPNESLTYNSAHEDPRRSSYLDSQDPRYSSSSVRAPSPGPQRRESKKYQRDSYLDDGRGVVTVEPGEGPRKSSMKRDASPGPNSMKRDASPGPLRSAMKRDSSPLPPTARMSSLSVNTGLPTAAGLSVAAAPGSPLLESYHGTYQSMSPMPSPLLLPTHGGADVVEAMSPVGSDDERGDKKRSRRARFHDPVDDAARLAKALKGEKRAPEIEPLIEILPGMTQEQIMELRVEYKRLVKTGSERKGVNIAKHIRARLKDEDPSLMKACYATALGQWESEAYWANFWYQGDKTRRELLIEALMGRTNDEIREIKAGFSDKKYSNSLTKCMKTELKEDKFKKAVLLVLDEQRMDEYDAYGRPARIDTDLVRDDVKKLHHAVKSDKGGESLMITTVIQRSDTHLREVMRKYTEHYGSNLAKDALKKSGNLVGEVLAHILNGVINKPARDALLLHHAITATKKDELRRELLISRLVRYHWDRKHMAAIKLAYRERYGQDLQTAVHGATSGDWGEFCRALCISRMPDDVKRVERVQISH